MPMMPRRTAPGTGTTVGENVAIIDSEMLSEEKPTSVVDVSHGWAVKNLAKATL